jgi:signal transduction histidine kinase
MNEAQITEPTQNRYFLLYELFQTISSTLDPQKALDLIIDAAVQLTGASSGSLCLVDWQRGVLDIEVSRGFVQPLRDLKLKVGEGITGWVAKTGDALLVGDTSKDSRYVEVKQDIRSELAVPLTINGKLIGVVNVDSVRLNAFDIEDLELLTLLSKQSALMIQNARLFATVQRKVEELTTLIEISKTVASTLALDKTLNEIVARTAKLMDSKLCTISLLSDDGESLILRAYYGKSVVQSNNRTISVRESLIGKVILTGQPLQVADVQKEPSYHLSEFAEREGLFSLLAVPLKVRERVIGVIIINKSTFYSFSDEEITLMRTFADLCAVTIENVRLYEKMVMLEEQTRRAERLAAVGELAAGVAHEIRNPLTIIKMIFESGAALNAKDIEIITEELERMRKNVTHLLKFAKPIDPNREMCDVNEGLENVLFLLTRLLDEKRIVLQRALDANLPKIYADPIQLRQVFLNLLMNSIEALPENGMIRVTSVRPANGWIRIQIEDNGIGMPQQVKDKLFVPFTTTKPTGLGLGLSIVKRIIKGHKGKIRIESAENRGTTVEIDLPQDDLNREPGSD